MDSLIFFQIIVALGLLNVWIVRSGNHTPYRGGEAHSLKEEFNAYGLPDWFFYFVGFLKVTSAILLIIGIWLPFLVFPAASLISVLMVGAIAMHLKVKDPLTKSVPALIVLLLSAYIAFYSYNDLNKIYDYIW